MARGNQSSRKRVKLTDVERAIAPCLDIISSLPDSILCHILSFLPTKASVATSIIARRWKFLWTHVMSIKFDAENDHMDPEVFPDAVNRVLLLNNARCINTFSLHLSHGYGWCSGYQFATWISTAVARNVQLLDLVVHQEFRLPHCFFISKTLVEFTLKDYSCLSVGSVCLPNLKKLHLDYVSYENGESLPKLISGCLVLEELRIRSIGYGNSINISSPTLKHLTLYSPVDTYFDETHKTMLNLDTPALQYLDLEDHFYYRISSQNLSSIVEANIYLNNYHLKEDIPYLCSLFEFIESVSMVKCLKLSCRLEMKLLSTTISGSTTKFHNLVKLDFEADWRLLTRFLESADRLEVLIIKKVDDNLRCWRETEKVPECLLSCLRTVTIYQFGYRETDFKMVRYILRNARFLKRMEIHFNRFGIYSGTKSIARRRISHFRRGSEACELAFIC